MEYLRIKQDELREAAQRLGDSGGGSALRLCIEGVDLIKQRGDVLDERHRRMVIEAVAEVLCMSVQIR